MVLKLECPRRPKRKTFPITNPRNKMIYLEAKDASDLAAIAKHMLCIDSLRKEIKDNDASEIAKAIVGLPCKKEAKPTAKTIKSWAKKRAYSCVWFDGSKTRKI
jgi:hypothetical protein